MQKFMQSANESSCPKKYKYVNIYKRLNTTQRHSLKFILFFPAMYIVEVHRPSNANRTIKTRDCFY